MNLSWSYYFLQNCKIFFVMKICCVQIRDIAHSYTKLRGWSFSINISKSVQICPKVRFLVSIICRNFEIWKKGQKLSKSHICHKTDFLRITWNIFSFSSYGIMLCPSSNVWKYSTLLRMFDKQASNVWKTFDSKNLLFAKRERENK